VQDSADTSGKPRRPILVSACLLGHPVRYDGASAEGDHRALLRWAAEGRVIPVCPEVAGGLPTPRRPAEISRERGGPSVSQGEARVIDAAGRDVTDSFIKGAGHALVVARARGVRLAVLKDGSPSCGSSYVYDGSFTGRRIPGRGVTAAVLRDAGITVFSEAQLEEASLYLARLETEDSV